MRTPCILAFALLLATTATAQIGEKKDPAYDPPTWAMIDDSLGHALGLTHEQMKQVQTADENYRIAVKEGAIGALEKRDKDLRALMLPTQYDKWADIARKRRMDAGAD